MPKDNEVDEKADLTEPVGFSYWAVQTPGRMPKLYGAHAIANFNWYPESGDWLIRLQEVERYGDGAPKTLDLAATVAELRAEVERLDACIDAIHENWMNYGPHREIVARADAAERRVGELTSLLSDTAGNLRRMANDEFADCDQERLDIVISRIERTLTGADPT